MLVDEVAIEEAFAFNMTPASTREIKKSSTNILT
jgi:hypothetical protein